MSVSTTSSVIKSLHKYTIVGSLVFLVFVSPLFPLTVPLPFIVLCTTAGKLGFLNGLVLAFIWCTWLCFCFFPLFVLFKSLYCLYVVYTPILIFFKSPSVPATQLYVIFLYVIWDAPQLLWIFTVSFFGWRALEPFYTPITEHICVGSLPLPSDVEYLSSSGIVCVINMCGEYRGPTSKYDQYNIKQLWLPTPDLCEPTFDDAKKAIDFIEEAIATKFANGSTADRVFIHCKGGRGRAVSIALCYLLSTGMSLDNAVKLIKDNRNVASTDMVLNYKVVRRYSGGTSVE